MIRRPPRSTRTDTLFPYTTLFRSGLGIALDTRWSDLEIAVVGETEGGCNRLPFVEKRRITRDRHGDFLPARMYCTYSCENGLLLTGEMARSGVAWTDLGQGWRRRTLKDEGGIAPDVIEHGIDAEYGRTNG